MAKDTAKVNVSVGVDYGILTGSNRDKETGIHYGVISQHSLSPDMIYEVMAEGADYGLATCPDCGYDAVDNDQEHNALIEHEEDCQDKENEDCACLEFKSYSRYGCADYLCLNCRHTLDSSEVFSEEMLGWSYEQDGYKLQDCLTNDVFVLESPYYTYAQFCSPCVPGAGNLDSPLPMEISGDLPIDQDAPRVYCLGHDWFEDGQAPYRVFKVVDGSEVRAEVVEGEAGK